MQKKSKMHQRVDAATRKHDQNADAVKNKSALAHAIDATDDPKLKAAFEALPHVALPKDPFWDDAAKFYHETTKAILDTNESMALHLQEFLADDSIPAADRNSPKLAVLVNALSRDVGEQLSRLSMVYAAHSDKSGACKDADEVIKVMEINGTYSDIIEIFHSLIAPTAGQIFEMTGAYQKAAQAELQAAQNKPASIEEAIVGHINNMVNEHQQSLVDPTVITDVVFKDVQ